MMIKTRSVGLYERVRAALAAGEADTGATIGTVDVAQYLSPELTSLEAKLLHDYPQPVAVSSELPAPGAWLARNRFSTPFLLVRQPDGQVHAFLNVCRHRGAVVVPEGAGLEARAFVCPYHAWTYRPDGSLRGVPQAAGFPCLDHSASGLRRLAATERAGVIWVIPNPALSEQDPNECLGPLMAELESLGGLEAPVSFAPRTYAVAANWKLLVDGTFEAYHFKVAHRKTIAPMFADNMQLVDEYGLNRRLYLVKSNFAQDQPSPENFDPRKYGNLIYFFFPNTVILVQPDHAQLSYLEPINEGSTNVHEVTLIPEAPASEKAASYWQANVDLYRRTLMEDYELSESIQTGLASKANAALTFGTFEFSAPKFHAQLNHCLSKNIPPEGACQ